MESSNQLNKLIDSVEKSKNYLEGQVDLNPSYSDLIDTLEETIDQLNNSKPVIKIFSPTVNLASNLKIKSEANSKLRSLYDFVIIDSVKNVVDLVDNCQLICLVYHSHQQINKAQQKLIERASKNNLNAIVLVKQNKRGIYNSLLDWLTSQECQQLEQIQLPVNSFIDLNHKQHIQLFRQFLIFQAPKLRAILIEQQSINITNKIEQFFQSQNTETWQKIEQIKDSCLQGKIPNQYQQIIKQTFNQIERQQRQAFTQIKQNINQSKSSYLNPFMPDSWMFEIQQIIQSSQVVSQQESETTYLYLKVNNQKNIEYIHSYILGLYQQKVTDTLYFHWSKINYDYGEGGIKAWSDRVNLKLAEIGLLPDAEKQLDINLNSELPSLDLTKIIDFHCLKLNSRIVFDYKYSQSSWFKLLISIVVGISIYFITKLYFGEGRYIGFVILIFQTINIITGQDIRSLKLKQHQKELQRTINNKYQTLIRLITEQLIQTLIVSLDKQDRLYQQQIEAIATLAHTKIDEAQKNIKQHKAKIDRLKQDREKILSWFN